MTRIAYNFLKSQHSFFNNLYLFAAIWNVRRRSRNLGKDWEGVDNQRGRASRPPDVAGGLRDREEAGRQQQQQQQQQQHLPAGNY